VVGAGHKDDYCEVPLWQWAVAQGSIELAAVPFVIFTIFSRFAVMMAQGNRIITTVVLLVVAGAWIIFGAARTAVLIWVI
jgi:hypothetical protein